MYSALHSDLVPVVRPWRRRHRCKLLLGGCSTRLELTKMAANLVAEDAFWWPQLMWGRWSQARLCFLFAFQIWGAWDNWNPCSLGWISQALYISLLTKFLLAEGTSESLPLGVFLFLVFFSYLWWWCIELVRSSVDFNLFLCFLFGLFIYFILHLQVNFVNLVNRHNLAGNHVFEEVLSKLKLVDSMPLISQLAVNFGNGVNFLEVRRFAFSEHGSETHNALHTSCLKLALKVLEVLNCLSLIDLIFEIGNMR